MKELGVMNVPYLVLYHKGTLLFTHNGLISRTELENLFEENKLKYTEVQGVIK